jgi:DNA-binding CsgD family transcriptional regulator
VNHPVTRRRGPGDRVPRHPPTGGGRHPHGRPAGDGGASAGRLDGDAVAAVLDAAGHPATRVERPAGLTERETQVVALVARGLQTKRIARALEISPKTADRHIQNAYKKIGVSTRAAATLFAMEHGLLRYENNEQASGRQPQRRASP